jgi:DNA-binding MarR family transcriptional regulator
MKNKLNLIEDLILSELRMFNMMQFFRGFITDTESRLIVYEVYCRERDGLDPVNVKWVEEQLEVSFPTAFKIIEKLINEGFLMKSRGAKDKRSFTLHPTNALKEGIKTYTMMWLEKAIELELIKMSDKEKNELYKGLKIQPNVRKFDELSQELHAKLHNDLISLND